MIANGLSFIIKENIGFPPTAEQEKAIAVFCEFLTDQSEETVTAFIVILEKEDIKRQGRHFEFQVTNTQIRDHCRYR